MALPHTAANRFSEREIVADMCSDWRMHRLLQGDVGSGKTIVALFAAMLAIENGFQVAVMAPTELLAEQHARTFERMLQPLGISPMLLTGSLGAKARRAAATRLASEEPVLVVGTHALVQEGVRFADLSLAVVDEQHRFGVHQRMALKGKGPSPDVLIMTATPIPRTLAMTAYADLDTSVIDELPPGRTPIATKWLSPIQRREAFATMRAEIEAGRQAFVICPLVEGSDTVESRAATEEFERLKRVTPDTLTDIQRAARFFYLQKCCFGGRIVKPTFGTAVTIIEGLPRLVPAEDEAISKTLERTFRKRGIQFKTGVKFASATQDENSVTIGK